jgi:cell division protein FtsB
MALLSPIPRKFKGVFAIVAVALALFVVAAVFGDHGLMHLRQQYGLRQELEEAAFQLQQKNESLRQRARRLQSDDLYLEKLARERLGLVRKGDVVYRLDAVRPEKHAKR